MNLVFSTKKVGVYVIDSVFKGKLGAENEEGMAEKKRGGKNGAKKLQPGAFSSTQRKRASGGLGGEGLNH